MFRKLHFCNDFEQLSTVNKQFNLVLSLLTSALQIVLQGGQLKRNVFRNPVHYFEKPRDTSSLLVFQDNRYALWWSIF